ncbi:MAG: hypothetical protein ABIU06_19950 [Anaerolineales bacterium]
MKPKGDISIHKIYFTLSTLVLASLLAGCAGSAVAQSNDVVLTDVSEKVESTIISKVVSQDHPADCPVTTNITSFEAPAPYSPNAPWPGEFWHESEHLWTALPTNGVWADLPNNTEGYTQKIFWWSSLFTLKDELEPALVVFGERLDSKSPPLKVSPATNAFDKDIGNAMLVGVDFPTLGCWKITGQYKKTGLDFVVWVAP